MNYNFNNVVSKWSELISIAAANHRTGSPICITIVQNREADFVFVSVPSPAQITSRYVFITYWIINNFVLFKLLFADCYFVRHKISTSRHIVWYPYQMIYRLDRLYRFILISIIRNQLWWLETLSRFWFLIFVPLNNI